MEAFPPQEQQAVETPHLEIEEQGFIARASEFARDHMPRKLTAGAAAAVLAVSGAGVELATAEAEIAPALPNPSYKLSPAQCAWRATHPVAKSIKSKFVPKGATSGKYVEVDGAMRDIRTCEGQYTWKVQIRKENKHGYYNSSKKIMLAHGQEAIKVSKVIKTNDNNTACDCGEGPPTFDAYQNNYFQYKDSRGVVKRKVKTPIKPITPYC